MDDPLRRFACAVLVVWLACTASPARAEYIDGGTLDKDTLAELCKPVVDDNLVQDVPKTKDPDALPALYKIKQACWQDDLRELPIPSTPPNTNELAVYKTNLPADAVTASQAPEPSSLLLLATGAVVFVWLRRLYTRSQEG